MIHVVEAPTSDLVKDLPCHQSPAYIVCIDCKQYKGQISLYQSLSRGSRYQDQLGQIGHDEDVQQGTTLALRCVEASGMIRDFAS
jgi:hypothetical protein